MEWLLFVRVVIVSILFCLCTVGVTGLREGGDVRGRP